MLLGAIADDYTGATDLCSVLSGEGMRVVQTVGVQRGVELPDADAVVVALKSRTAPVATAVADSRSALAWLLELGAQRFYFKICSTFDSKPHGNIGPVADALLDDLGTDFAVVTPAYPANGRAVFKGHLFVGDALLSESSMARHPLTPMTDSNLVRVLQRQTPRRVGLLERGHDPDSLRARGVTYAIADAIDDDDLRDLAARCTELPLLVGGAGLATALPRAFGLDRKAAAPPPRPTGPAIVVAGSCSAATLAQVARMKEHYPAYRVDEFAGYDGETVLVYTSAPPEERIEVAPGEIESKLANVAKEAVANGARRVVVAGGETSGAVVQALGVRALAVGGEIAPGVPWMTSIDDPQLALALKSGNFGDRDFFLEALEE